MTLLGCKLITAVSWAGQPPGTFAPLPARLAGFQCALPCQRLFI